MNVFISISLFVLAVWFFSLWRRGLKERASLQALVLSMLLDQEIYDNQVRQLDDFLDEDDSETLDDLFRHLIDVYARLALKNRDTFHASAGFFLEERFKNRRRGSEKS